MYLYLYIYSFFKTCSGDQDGAYLLVLGLDLTLIHNFSYGNSLKIYSIII